MPPVVWLKLRPTSSPLFTLRLRFGRNCRRACCTEAEFRSFVFSAWRIEMFCLRAMFTASSNVTVAAGVACDGCCACVALASASTSATPIIEPFIYAFITCLLLSSCKRRICFCCHPEHVSCCHPEHVSCCHPERSEGSALRTVDPSALRASG